MKKPIIFVNIEAERGRKGMSRTEFSEQLGIDTDTYKRYLTGESSIPSAKLILMAKMFKCSTDYLLGLDNFED